MLLLCDMGKLVKTNVLLEEGQLKEFKPVVQELGYTNVSAYLRDHFKDGVKKHERKQKRK